MWFRRVLFRSALGKQCLGKSRIAEEELAPRVDQPEALGELVAIRVLAGCSVVVARGREPRGILLAQRCQVPTGERERRGSEPERAGPGRGGRLALEHRVELRLGPRARPQAVSQFCGTHPTQGCAHSLTPPAVADRVAADQVPTAVPDPTEGAIAALADLLDR